MVLIGSLQAKRVGLFMSAVFNEIFNVADPQKNLKDLILIFKMRLVISYFP